MACIALCAHASYAAVPNAGKRIALVIGNANYANTVALPNTANDAAGMVQALNRLGFDVVSGVDLTHDDMNQLMKQFARKLVGADVGLLYYAGHGMQVGGRNYLIPVDAALKHEADLEFEAVKVDVIMERMLASTRIKVVILDACRDNPLATQLARSMGPLSRSMNVNSGMSRMDTGASGTLVAFATAPGDVALDGEGENSPFTAALLRHIETPGLDIDVMMKRVRGDVARSTSSRQQPWTNSALNGEFYLRPAASAGMATTDTSAVVANAATSAARNPEPAVSRSGQVSSDTLLQLDMEAWRSADRGGQGGKADYELYLSNYPNGQFADQARANIARLSSTSTTGAQLATLSSASTGLSNTNITTVATEQAEDAIGLRRTDWYEIQRKLKNLGFNPRGVDGSPGPGTRGAIREWQSSRSLTPTGYLDASQRVALLAQPLPAGTVQKTRSASKKSSKSKQSSTSKDNNDAVGAAIIGIGVGIAACKLSGRC